MPKITWNKFMLMLVLLLVIIVIAQIVYSYYVSQQNQNNSYMVAGPVDHVLVIDLNTEADTQMASTFNAEDVILGVQMGSQPDQHADDLILSRDVLGFLQKYSNGVISLGDPLFNRLELLFLDQNNNLQMRYSSLATAGIRAILLRSKRNQFLGIFGRPYYVAGEAVMADGTKRQIREVVIKSLG